MEKETPPPPSATTTEMPTAGLTQPTQPAQPTAIGVGITPPEWGEKGRSSSRIAYPDEPPPFVPVDDGTLNDKEWRSKWDLF